MINKFAITGSAKNFDSKVECPGISAYLQSLGMLETSIEDCEGLIFGANTIGTSSRIPAPVSKAY